MRRLTWVLLGVLLATSVGLNAATGGKLGEQFFTLMRALAGERNEDSTTGTDYLTVSSECKPSAAIDLSTNASTTVYPGPAVLCGVDVVVTVGVAAATIDDNATMKYTAGIGIPVGSHDGFGAILATSLVVNPDDASTGTIIVYYHPLDPLVVW